MLQISDEARTALKDTLDEVAEDGNVFRLGRDGEELAIGLGDTEVGDEVYDLDGAPILAVPTELAQELDVTIDVEHTNEGPRLVLT